MTFVLNHSKHRLRRRNHHHDGLRWRCAAGFTLVELLVVIALLAVLAGMATASYQGVAQTARVARTRSIIAAVDSVIQEKYESYKYRPLAVEIPDMFNPSNQQQGVEFGFEALAMESARVRMLMTRDLQRMEMPDRLSDIMAPTGNAVTLRAAVSPVGVDASTGQIIGQRDAPGLRRMMQVNWFGGASDPDNIPSQLAAYRSRLVGTTPTVQHQGAECLYLIMSTSFIGGTPAIDAIPGANIGDTDGDGLAEILDGWGQPLQFIRWPVGYIDPSGVVDRTVPDDFDLFRSDYAYATTAAASPAQALNVEDGTAVRPWSTRPLIYSVGSDGAGGIATNPWVGASELTTFAYSSNWSWPTDADHYGADLPGRTRGIGTATYGDHSFPDPFLRRFVEANTGGSGFAGLLPGQQLLGTNAATERVDNVTNYQLQATE